ncbi:MAG TPA: AAA family ATPase [Planctomycetota bacterium]|nr:AAA family ATPase [Planctomycetota bacterium]
MKMTIPVYIEQQRQNDTAMFSARPLFFPEPEAQGEHLNRVLTRLTGRLTSAIADLARGRDHRPLLRYTFCPTFADSMLDIPVQLQDRTLTLRILLVVFDAMGRTVAFSPQHPRLWFTVEGGQSLRERAAEVYSQHFKKLARERPADVVLDPERDGLKGKAWVTTVDVEVTAKQDKLAEAHPFAFLGPQKVPEGQMELNRVGRCLDWLYPDELERALFRDDEVSQLQKLLEDPQRRAVLIVGAPGVGKTALIHETLYRRHSARSRQPGTRRNTWLLSPQRLILGMSYVGEWENRVLAILEAARQRQHTLYFDDLLGLFHAGQTSQSQLSVAHVLKPFIERREVRVLGEITPEAFRVLQEVDRGFADLFQILRLSEPPEEQTLRILIRVQQELEGRHNMRFDLDCLPTIIDLQRRYVRDIVFPGKAASFMRQLAVKSSNGAVRRVSVLSEFQNKSGLSMNVLDQKRKLTREEIIEGIGSRIIGQRAAAEAFADAICIAKARLNDPGKPVAVFLFLGPTGVGKTQCAKALAEYLFGSAERLVRFDLNEFVAEDSVARLAGTLWQPDGLLTSAVRRQPFSVVLLDEVEKAHPAIFDLLLQVLGEGRLTDARGRTVDFTNTIVIMTSNLGVQEASSSLGLKRADRSGDASVYVRAAERFFRPEFFNRIDRVLPFTRLSRDEISKIATLLIADVFQREGLTRRKCILEIHPAAMERVIEEGYHPELGARALKRAIERQLTRPAAEYLAAFPPFAPAVISLYPRAQGVAAHVRALVDMPCLAGNHSQRDVLRRLKKEEILACARAALKRFEKAIDTHRPPGQIDTTPAYQHYFALREAFTRLKGWTETLSDLLGKPRHRNVRRGAVHSRVNRATIKRLGESMRANWSSLFAAQDIHAFVRDLAVDASNENDFGELAGKIVEHCSLLDLMLSERKQQPAALIFRWFGANPPWARFLPNLYLEAFRSIGGVDVSEIVGLPDLHIGLLLDGNFAHALACNEASTQIEYWQGDMTALHVIALPLKRAETATQDVLDFLKSRETWLAQLASGQEKPEDDPIVLRPVLRIYDERQCAIDMRSLQVTSEAVTARDMRSFICGALAPSLEFLNAEEQKT